MNEIFIILVALLIVVLFLNSRCEETEHFETESCKKYRLAGDCLNSWRSWMIQNCKGSCTPPPPPPRAQRPPPPPPPPPPPQTTLPLLNIVLIQNRNRTVGENMAVSATNSVKNENKIGPTEDIGNTILNAAKIAAQTAADNITTTKQKVLLWGEPGTHPEYKKDNRYIQAENAAKTAASAIIAKRPKPIPLTPIEATWKRIMDIIEKNFDTHNNTILKDITIPKENILATKIGIRNSFSSDVFANKVIKDDDVINRIKLHIKDYKERIDKCNKTGVCV
jgi:hypothetical protein